MLSSFFSAPHSQYCPPSVPAPLLRASLLSTISIRSTPSCPSTVSAAPFLRASVLSTVSLLHFSCLATVHRQLVGKPTFYYLVAWRATVSMFLGGETITLFFGSGGGRGSALNGPPNLAHPFRQTANIQKRNVLVAGRRRAASNESSRCP